MCLLMLLVHLVVYIYTYRNTHGITSTEEDNLYLTVIHLSIVPLENNINSNESIDMLSLNNNHLSSTRYQNA